MGISVHSLRDVEPWQIINVNPSTAQKAPEANLLRCGRFGSDLLLNFYITFSVFIHLCLEACLKASLL